MGFLDRVAWTLHPLHQFSGDEYCTEELKMKNEVFNWEHEADLQKICRYERIQQNTYKQDFVSTPFRFLIIILC